MRHYFTRHQTPTSLRAAVIGGLGALLGVAALGFASDLTGMAMLFAPLGATCVLLFGLPASPLSQPVNVVLGHALAGAFGFGAHLMLPGQVWVAAGAVGAAIALMGLLRITHPPAGATALVTYAAAQSWFYLAFPVLTGAAGLVLIASAYHRLTGTVYPLKPGRA